MYSEIEKWLDTVLNADFPEGTRAVVFNIYDDGDNMWSFEAVCTSRFDMIDEDWACDELSDLDTRDEPFSWEEAADSDEILQKVCGVISAYLENGEYGEKLKALEGVAAGFTDGDLEVLYSKRHAEDWLSGE